MKDPLLPSPGASSLILPLVRNTESKPPLAFQTQMFLPSYFSTSFLCTFLSSIGLIPFVYIHVLFPLSSIADITENNCVKIKPKKVNKHLKTIANDANALGLTQLSDLMVSHSLHWNGTSVARRARKGNLLSV